MSYNIYQNYDETNQIVTKVLTTGDTDRYENLKYEIGSAVVENVPTIVDIGFDTDHGTNIVSIVDNSFNLNVTISESTEEAPVISVDPSYIASLDGSMTLIDNINNIWSGKIKVNPDMNRLDNSLNISIGTTDSSNVLFSVVEDDSYYNNNHSLHRKVKLVDIANIIYPDTSSNFEILFTTNDKSLNDISGNLQLNVATPINLQLAH